MRNSYKEISPRFRRLDDRDSPPNIDDLLLSAHQQQTLTSTCPLSIERLLPLCSSSLRQYPGQGERGRRAQRVRSCRSSRYASTYGYVTRWSL
jgi:hypothetical protein